jgi:hypothetical protein
VLVAAGSGPSGAGSSSYLPSGTTPAFAGKIVCTSCHFIHAADGRYGLLRGFPGSPDPHYFLSLTAFCVECHGSNLAGRSPHNGGERSCGFCHAGRPPEAADRAPSSFRVRCELCHRDVTPAHYDQLTPFEERQECEFCHDRHAVAADSPGLLAAAYRAAAVDSVVIRPHFRRGLCFACHENLDDYALRDEDINALCNRCHASGRIPANVHPLLKVPPQFSVPKGWPLNGGTLTCLTCHEQGHEDQEQRPRLLRGGPYADAGEACRTCHGATGLKKSTIHQRIEAGESCELCHAKRPEPGKDTPATVSFIADPDLLCLRCHLESLADDSLHHGDVVGREVKPGDLEAGLPLFKRRIICATCHDQHRGQPQGFRLRKGVQRLNYCTSCHEK